MAAAEAHRAVQGAAVAAAPATWQQILQPVAAADSQSSAMAAAVVAESLATPAQAHSPLAVPAVL